MVQFDRVTLKNFMSFQDETFEDLGEPGLTLVEGRNLDEGGSNGSGKSTMWDAISWAMFGQTVRGLKNEEIINRKAGKGCSVCVFLKHNGFEYTVARYRKSKEFGNRLIVFKDQDFKGVTKTETVELGTLAMTQDWLIKELGIDFELFRCTVLFAQGETFNFINETNKRQKEILSKVMHIDYRDMLTNAKKNFRSVEDEYDQIDRKFDVLESHLVEDPDELFADEILDWESKRLTKVKDLKEDIKALKVSMNECKAGIEDTGPLTDKMNDYKAKHIEVYDKIEKLQSKRASVKTMIVMKNKEHEKMSGLIEAGKCPTCEQDIDGGMWDLKEIEKYVAALSKTADKIQVGLDKFNEQRKEYDSKYNDYKDAILRSENQEKDYKWYGKGHSTKMQDMKDIVAELNPYELQKTKALEKQDSINRKLKQIEKTKIKLSEVLPYHQFWIDAFGDAGIKSFVFDLICSSLTNKANGYLNSLSGGSISVSFDTQKKLKSGELREKFDVSINMNGEVVSYESYSGGEKRRVSLAVDMALSDLMSDYYGAEFNMIVFDEQTNFLDQGGREQFMGLLTDLSKTKHVYVVDHDAQFKAMFDDVITIEKRGGVSHAH